MKTISAAFLKLILIFICMVFTAENIHAMQPSALKCEYLVRPIGVDNAAPRLSWLMLDSRKGALQSAYRIIIGLDSLQLSSKQGIQWDSGKVLSANSLITYRGRALNPFTKYYWRLELWDKDNKPGIAVVSSFEMGMMGMENWKGTWISDNKDINTLPAPYFRKVFQPTKQIKSARAYIAAAGLYELYLNGKKVGDHRLDPMYTRFDRRNLYVSYDVTANLKQGNNAVGVLLGNGWYNHQSLAVWNFDKAPWRARPTFCLDLRITYTDGTTEVITSGNDWKTSLSPIVSNSIYTAEHYDARLEQKGWNTADFDDSKWRGISLRAAPSKNIVSQMMHPIRNVDEIAVKTMRKFNDSTYLFDLGRNIAGVTRLKVRGEKGTVIRLKHAERLDAGGHADLSNIDVYHRPKDKSDPFQTDIWTLNGEGEEEFMPLFNYKGFQYIEVSSSRPIKLTEKSLVGYFMHSDVPAVGKISSSNPLVDKLWWATNNSYLSNLYGFPTDCPQREKNGWTGDGHFAVETGLYNFDGITVYEKWMGDHRDEQQPNGVLPDIIPTGGWGYGTANGTDWTSTIAIIPWDIYMFYGDSKLLSDNYQSIKQYVNYVDGISKGHLTTFGRGDWVPVKSTSDLEYTSSVYFYVDANILAKAAKLFNRQNDYLIYSALAEKIKNAINAKYFDSAKGIYGKGVQTELSVALQWNIVPDAYRKTVADNLAKRVIADGMHIDVGVLGAKAVLNALSDNGHSDIAYKLASQDTYPGWGWWIVNGATTLHENWDMDAKRDISDNHMMFGEIGAWFFKGIGGIKIDEQQPGFKNILLKPHFVDGLSHFEASHESPFGLISSSWKRTAKGVDYEVLVPANSTATVDIPLISGKKIYLDGKEYNDNQIKIKAGKYHFEIR
ncbi:glycoside hydrolase family 78 protein [Pedobacter mucosus]|uniref:glycoside hydrolase family 78 protein n=1 Tax=Pedobacter mucosus TaxID=2895286 RepID=UPI001EE3C62A|nr:glycoside hydrolase family 78 protein [Pedobacter mucosus]UKT65390.1 glycoside hydrolase family 78 protein [Pedobacter mucosus]